MNTKKSMKSKSLSTEMRLLYKKEEKQEDLEEDNQLRSIDKLSINFYRKNYSYDDFVIEKELKQEEAGLVDEKEPSQESSFDLEGSEEEDRTKNVVAV